VVYLRVHWCKFLFVLRISLSTRLKVLHDFHLHDDGLGRIANIFFHVLGRLLIVEQQKLSSLMQHLIWGHLRQKKELALWSGGKKQITKISWWRPSWWWATRQSCSAASCSAPCSSSSGAQVATSKWDRIQWQDWLLPYGWLPDNQSPSGLIQIISWISVQKINYNSCIHTTSPTYLFQVW